MTRGGDQLSICFACWGYIVYITSSLFSIDQLHNRLLNIALIEIGRPKIRSITFVVVIHGVLGTIE